MEPGVSLLRIERWHFKIRYDLEAASGMAFLNFWYKTSLAVLCLSAFGAQCCSAQIFNKDPAKWWPDPTTGLMWAEHGYSGNSKSTFHPHGLTWQQSVDYCSALKLGGYSGWRIPTLDEVKGIGYTRHGVVFTSSEPDMTANPHHPALHQTRYDVTTSDPQDWVTLKVPEWSDLDLMFYTFVWTSTPTPDAEKPAKWIAGPTVWIVGDGLNLGAIPKTWDMYSSNYMASLCVRPMDPDLLELAKDAQVDVPVPDPQMLKAYVSVNKARLAY